jgi:very-short-patch-repair endonuclease
VKIRGKPIEEVIAFHAVETEGSVGVIRKTNPAEVTAIVERLQELKGQDLPVDCCVITPHTEQQRLVLREINKLPEGNDLIERLNLKVFTFDTCQGEERDTILYSMVASQEEDRLNYVFPKNLDGSDEVEESLRLQRLNVGFSRAKERIEIFHSKPLNEFQGSIATALNHFENTVQQSQASPTAADVDPNSPMELKVLGWLRQVPVIEELGEQVEVDAQFEVGVYLRQIDPTYKHPNYKVDFLLKVAGPKSSVQIIIEYDGFKEHFTDLQEVDASNYQHYMKPADVERQKILEGYGYKFLRLNRFNLGDNPVLTLDERIRALISDIDTERQAPSLIEKYQQQQTDLETGDSKVCTKCGSVKPIDEFFDSSLKAGAGGHGRMCMSCKGSKKPKRGRSRRRARGNVRLRSGGKRTYLACPYADKGQCKKLGGRWDAFEQKWYVPDGLDLEPFGKWISTAR